MPVLVYGQFVETFADRELTSQPEWQGKLSDFWVNEDGRLQLNAGSAGTSYIYTSYELSDNFQWLLSFELDFSPSNQNQIRIHFLNSEPSTSEGQGYYLELGESGDRDVLKLFYRDNDKQLLLAEGIMDRLIGDRVEANLEIKYDSSIGIIISTIMDQDTVFNEEIYYYPDPIQETAYFFLIECTYTSSRTDKFFFDFISLGENMQKPLEIFQPSSGDLLINEILFDPYKGSSDFIELINVSDNDIDLRGLEIRNLENQKSVTIRQPYTLASGNYLAISKIGIKLDEHYKLKIPNNIFEHSLPAFNNDSGHPAIFFRDKLIDEFSYTDDLHNVLVDDTEGVSLERLSTFALDNKAENWTSASEVAGFATPGYENSGRKGQTETQTKISLLKDSFSPNQDGFEDLLEIEIIPEEANAFVTIIIFDYSGHPIKHLANNVSLGSYNIISWDGTNDDQSQSSIGIYIITALVFDLNGNTTSFKTAAALVDILD